MNNRYRFASRTSRINYELISDKIITIKQIKIVADTQPNAIIYDDYYSMIEDDNGVFVYLITSKIGLFVLSETFSYIVGLHVRFENHPLLNELYNFTKRNIDIINNDTASGSYKTMYKKTATFYRRYRANLDALGVPVVWYNNRGLGYLNKGLYINIDYSRDITLEELIETNRSLVNYFVDHRPNFIKVIQPFFATILTGTNRINKKINGLKKKRY